MNRQPLVSVVVPAYNVKQYLGRCVSSILEQTYTNIEIVLVDDGSTDGTSELCDTVAAADSRVHTIHKANGGLAEARNVALSHCRGAWIAFVDSDDFVSPIFIETLVRAALETDSPIAAVPAGFAFRNVSRCHLDETMADVPRTRVISSETMQTMLLYQQVDTGSQWHLLRRDMIGDDPYPRGLVYEDLATTYRFVHRADQVAFVDDRNLYAYRTRPDSIMRRQYSHLKGKSALIVQAQLRRDIEQWYPQLSDAVASRCFSLCRMVFAQTPVHSSSATVVKDRQDLWKVINGNSGTVLHDPNARKRERLAAAVSLMGEQPFTLFCQACRRMNLMR